jgi:predicted DNA-binding transcriptional regulator AlpA
MSEDDPVIYRRDLYASLRVSSETIRRWLKEKKLPAPDVRLSQRTLGWKLSTLRGAGIKI